MNGQNELREDYRRLSHLMKAEKPVELIYFIERALKRHPNNGLLKIARAGFLWKFDLVSFEEMQVCYKKALRKNPDNLKILYKNIFSLAM